MNNTDRFYLPRKRDEKAIVVIKSDGVPTLVELMKNLAMNRVNIGDDWVAHMQDDTNQVVSQMFITNTHTGQVIALSMEPEVLVHRPVIRVLETDTIEPSDEEDNQSGVYAFYPVPFTRGNQTEAINYTFVNFFKQPHPNRFYLIHQGAYIQWKAFIGDPDELNKEFEAIMGTSLNQEELHKFRLETYKLIVNAMDLNQLAASKGVMRGDLQGFIDTNS